MEVRKVSEQVQTSDIFPKLALKERWQHMVEEESKRSLESNDSAQKALMI
jgi:hypothetical protein